MFCRPGLSGAGIRGSLCR